MKIYDFTTYKDFINSTIKLLPNKGRGANLRISKALNIHPSLLSQILKGSKDFTLEQAFAMANYFGLNQLESECLITMVQKERAGTIELKKFFESQQKEILRRSQNLSQRLESKNQFTDEIKAIFYSNWYYSAIRLATSIPSLQEPFAIAKYLKLPIKIVNQALDFLVKHGLCVEKNGRYQMGPQRTHLDTDSPFIDRHRISWRLKAMENFNRISVDELVFTAPLSIAKEDIPKIRSLILSFIDEVSAKVEKTKPNTLACLNIDWVELFPD